MTTPPPPTACEQLARVADRLAERTDDPRRFLRALAWNGAGVRLDPRGFLDLARGGRNRFRGGGFRAEFDDGTTGQVRHFCGIAVAPVLIGERVTRWAMRTVLRDPETSADHRLSLAALEFSRDLCRGALPLADAGDWVRSRLAAPTP
jgi:hypothetical protein